ncbi:hypothetical protein LSTR_LSTR009836 [Laodelphax striatellus]|uniref:Chitin-binding type-2 domain-containing protein n=1 Tax=Laodelphax striatellus TaxID=195883 RepID=A0A482XRH1_LAOST|nr:hypothetical protein LSTR_LSTR009836 [Laodelphax striatellus]
MISTSCTHNLISILAIFSLVAVCTDSARVKRQGFLYHQQPVLAPAPIHGIAAHHPGLAVVPVRKPKPSEHKQDLSKVPGTPGVDFPLFHDVPPTNFHCGQVPAHPGIYANVETGCQAYHICHDGREGHQGASFLCPNGTLFNQHEFACDWWYNVNCAEAPKLYSLNLDPLKNPYAPKPKKEEEPAVAPAPHLNPYHEPQYYPHRR